MGSYTFTWEHDASEVFVTGTFDDWRQSVKLEKEGSIFKKTVELPKTKVEYKFVVDGNWVTNDTAPGEFDGPNYNNILLPEDIKEAPVHTLSSAAPDSSTAAMAGAVPKEKESSPVPGAFPETPAGEPSSFSVNPIPATEGAGNPIHLAPGEKVPDPSTLTKNTIQSTVNDDEPEPKSFGVNPIPATAGAGNPIHLAPGEKVPDPSTLTSNTISSTVKTDEKSYEASDAAPPQLGPVVTPEDERESKGGVTIQSAAPLSSTAALAGAVPKEPRVPEVVSESQHKAHASPEASANPEAVSEKKEVEAELKDKVPEEPAASESTATGKAAEAMTGATYTAKDTAARIFGLNGSPAATATASEVPEIVKESQIKADVGPEAAANPEAVEEKKEVEQELLKEVKTTTEAGEPAPTVTAETSETAPGLSADALADVKPLKSSSEPDALNTPAAKAADVESPKAVDSRDISPMSKQPTTAPTAPIVTTGVESSKVEATSTPETPKKNGEASASGTPASVASKETTSKDKKKKRQSFFGKLKEKFHHDK